MKFIQVDKLATTFCAGDNVKMPILFIAGTASKEVRSIYLTELFKKINSSVYLNVDSLDLVFSQPSSSEFTQQYSYAQRVKIPSHEVVLELAQDNLRLNKTVILEGDFDEKIISDYIRNDYPELQKSGIRIIYFNNSNEARLDHDNLKNLEELAETTISIDTEKNLGSNIKKILDLLPNHAISEEKADNKAVLALSAGLAGVGKTTTCSLTSKQIKNSIFLQKDTIGLPFLKSTGQNMPSPYYNIHVKNQTYETLFRFALDNLKFNRTAILDGWFGDKLTGSWVREHLRASAYTTTLIYFHCTGPTELARIITRNAARDDEKLKDFQKNRQIDIEKHLKDFAQVANPSSICFVDTEKEENLNENVMQIVNHISSSGLKSLEINDRTVPFNEKNCAITQEEAQEGLQKFQSLLERSKKNDKHPQENKSSNIPLKISSLTARNTFWVEKIKAVEMDGFGLKLCSGVDRLWPLSKSDPISLDDSQKNTICRP